MYVGKIIDKDGIKDYDRIVYRGGDEATVRPGESVGIDPRFDLVNHSPTGFCWGYGGSGPAQLALAILADYLKDDKRALMLYMDFKFAVIARLPMDEDFTLPDRVIEDFITNATITRMRA